ncbi:hypothetical protein FQR65_LT16615 [Abscondita terminalis]|nr:hypothetical protein FQR65_LT16615 [Abscondita terminalis]
MDLNQVAKIKVIGVGGGGNNAVNRMVEENVQGVDFIVANTDAQVIAASKAKTKIILGKELSKGLGAGANPEIGRKSAIESEPEILKAISGSDLIFVAAGMGGGTGTGAAPEIARMARSTGALVIAIVTKPFKFEGRMRNSYATQGINELRKHVDSIIIVANDRLLEIIGGIPVQDSFREADNILKQGVQTITDLIAVPAVINLDFADVRTVMKGKGNALFGIGLGRGEDKAIEAANKAITSSLLETSIRGAKDAIINVTGGKNVSLNDAYDAVDIVQQASGEDVNIIFGIAINEHLDDELIVTVIATGFDQEFQAMYQDNSPQMVMQNPNMNFSDSSNETLEEEFIRPELRNNQRVSFDDTMTEEVETIQDIIDAKGLKVSVNLISLFGQSLKEQGADPMLFLDENIEPIELNVKTEDNINISAHIYLNNKSIGIYFKLGYNICVFDFRNHGQSDKNFVSFGLEEQKDLKSILEYINKNYKVDHIGIVGASMGAFTLNYFALNDYKFIEQNKVIFGISDSMYFSIYEVFKMFCNQESVLLSKFMDNIVEEAIDVYQEKYEIDLKQLELNKIYNKNEKTFPILFLHSKLDNITNYNNSIKAYDLRKPISPKDEINIFEKDEEYDKNIDYNEEEVQLLDDFKFKLTYYIKEFYSSKKNAINISYEDSVNSDNLFINPKNLSELEINSDGKANVSNEQFYRLQKDFDKIINFEALKKYVTESFEKDHNYSRIKKFIPKQLLNSIEIDQGNIGVEFLTDDKKNFQLKISSMVHYQYYDLAKNLQTKFTSPINVTISILNDKHFIEIINDFINGFSVNFYKELLQNVMGHHVTDQAGTGLVHIAGGFGEDDFKIVVQNNIKAFAPIDDQGKFDVTGDVILFTFSKPTKSEAVAQKVDFEIIYEDNDLLIVNKPNNLVVHPGAGNPDKTLVNGLLYKIKDLSSIGGVLRPGIVHRLDKKTTGLLIVAKNDKSHKALTEMLSTNQIYKEYVALVHGVISTNKGIINAPIGRHSGNRKKMAVTEKNSKCAVTNFEVIDRFEKFTLVKCNIETGDELYSFKEDTKIEFGQFLHAYKLKFKHPITNKEIEFKVAIPTEFNDKLKELNLVNFFIKTQGYKSSTKDNEYISYLYNLKKDNKIIRISIGEPLEEDKTLEEVKNQLKSGSRELISVLTIVLGQKTNGKADSSYIYIVDPEAYVSALKDKFPKIVNLKIEKKENEDIQMTDEEIIESLQDPENSKDPEFKNLAKKIKTSTPILAPIFAFMFAILPIVIIFLPMFGIASANLNLNGLVFGGLDHNLTILGGQ